MRTTHIALATALTLLSGAALAQSTTTKPATGTMAPASTTAPATTTEPATTMAPASPGTNSATGSSNPAVHTGTSTDMKGNAHMVAASALEKGANSFTEGEAKARLERAGLSNVSDLKKDNMGIWRGKAMHGGKSVAVGLDYKGNMAAQ